MSEGEGAAQKDFKTSVGFEDGKIVRSYEYNMPLEVVRILKEEVPDGELSQDEINLLVKQDKQKMRSYNGLATTALGGTFVMAGGAVYVVEKMGAQKQEASEQRTYTEVQSNNDKAQHNGNDAVYVMGGMGLCFTFVMASMAFQYRKQAMGYKARMKKFLSFEPK